MLTLLLSGALKGALVLALAFVLTRLLRQRSAAVRHLTWSTALLAAALLPLATAALPAWKVAVPHAIVAPTVVQAPAPLDGSIPTESVEPVSANVTIALSPSPPPAPVRKRIAPATLGLLAWGGVAALLLARLLLCFVQLARITRKAVPLVDPRWQALLARLTVRRVRLLSSERIEVPLTWGVFRPVVLLPASASAWSGERRDAVLRHELAHVQRLDTVTQLFAGVASAIYWFNPLMWLAARALERERERACDDRVLAAGIRPSGYAGELLELALASRSERYAGAALAMARRGELEGRLLSILDPKVRRTVPGSLAAAGVGAVALLLALPLAALQPGKGVRVLPAPPAPARAAAPPAAPAPNKPPPPPPASNQPSVPAPASVPNPASVPPRVGAPSQPAPAGAPAAVLQGMQLCPRGTSSHLSQNSSDSGDRTWRVSWSGDNCSVDLRARGDVQFTADFSDVRSLSPGGTLEINVRTGGELRRLEIRSEGGTLRRTWNVNGSEQPFDDAARRWLSAFLIELDRHTAFAVEGRLPALLQQGGADAVLDEIDRMVSDYARATYSVALLERSKLSSAQVRRLAQGSAEHIDSDYELGRVLKLIAAQYSLDDAGLRASFVAAAGTLQSDYERAQLLMTLIGKGAVSQEAGPTVVRLATAMSSDYEKARVLMALGESKLVDPKTVAPEYLAAVGKMQSDYERGRVLKLLAGSGQLGREALIRLLETTGTMSSDYEAASVLVAVAGKNLVDGDVRSAYLKAADRLHSDYEKQRATAALRTP